MMMDTANLIQDAGLLAKAQSFGKPLRSAAAMEQTAKSFESMFLAQMLEPMFEGVGEDSLGGNQYGDDVYRSWMVEQYAKMITENGGIGLTSQVKQELMKLQEIGATGKNDALPAQKAQPAKEVI